MGRPRRGELTTRGGAPVPGMTPAPSSRDRLRPRHALGAYTPLLVRPSSRSLNSRERSWRSAARRCHCWWPPVAGWAPFLAWVPALRAQLQNGSRAWIPPITPGPRSRRWRGVLGRPATLSLVALIAVLAWRQRPRLEPAWKATSLLVAVALLVPFALSLRHPHLLAGTARGDRRARRRRAHWGAPLARLLQPRALGAHPLRGPRPPRGDARGRSTGRPVPGGRLGPRRRRATSPRTPSPATRSSSSVSAAPPSATTSATRRSLRAPSPPRWTSTRPGSTPRRSRPRRSTRRRPALDQSLRACPVWLVSVGEIPSPITSAHAPGHRPRDASARLDGLF